MTIKYNSDNQIFQRAILHASRPRSRRDGGHDGKVGEGQFQVIRIKIKHIDPGIAYLRTNFTHNFLPCLALPIWGPILPTIFLNVSIVMFLFCKKRSGWRRRFWNWQVCKISEDDVGFDREARHQVQYVKAQQRKLRKILSLMLLCWSEPIEFLAV